MNPPLLHGTDWHGENVAGWIASEKLNGCRAYFDGWRLWTRQGNAIAAPRWFTDGLPAMPLDGEIYAGPAGFYAARNAVNYGRFTPQISFRVFDVPETGLPAEEAIARLQSLRWPDHAAPVAFSRVDSIEAALAAFRQIFRRGGEGVMLRRPGSRYAAARVDYLLKLTANTAN